MGWGMGVLMVVATVAFWAIVLMSVRSLLLLGRPAMGRCPGAPDETEAPAQRPPLRTGSSSPSRTAPIERHA